MSFRRARPCRRPLRISPRISIIFRSKFRPPKSAEKCRKEGQTGAQNRPKIGRNPPRPAFWASRTSKMRLRKGLPKKREIRSDSGTPLDSENEVFVREWLKFALFGRTPKSHNFGLHFRSFSGPRSAMMPTLGAAGPIFDRKCRVRKTVDFRMPTFRR